MKFYIIIPVFNNKKVTLKCLEQLYQQTFKEFDIYVIDDGSSDGTSFAIQDKYPQVNILKGDGNLWWAGATNKGLEAILPHAKNSDYVLTLNDDVFFENDYLECLARSAAERPEWLIGSVSIDFHNNKNIDRGHFFDWRTRGKITDSLNNEKYNDNVNVLSGRGTLIPVTVFKKIGLYAAKRLPQYAADYELANRAQKAGFNLCVYLGAIIYNDSLISGFKFTPFKKVHYNQIGDLLFSNKSVQKISTRFNYLLLCCPKKYYCRNIIVEIFYIALIITSIPLLWRVKKIF